MADKRFIYSFAGAAALSLALVGGMHAYRIANPPADHPAAKAAVPTLIEVEAPGAARANGVVSADEWAQYYPEIAKTMNANAENNNRLSYIEQDPYIVNLYDGYGFAIDYGSARGHTYVVEDVTSTGRPHKLANCFTCKTSTMTAKALNEGDSAYAAAFEDVEAEITDAFGCFHCHQNEPGTLYVTHTYLADALDSSIDSQNMQNLVCAQCHSEYYFATDTKATTFPYKGIENATPDAMLDYYNNLLDADGNAYADWVDEDTGVRRLKTQHPEFETISAAGGIHPDMTCVTCHMGKATADDGTAYTNHYWSSPLDNPELLESSCNVCHGDITSQVESIQKETLERLDAIGNGLKDANDKLAEAYKAGSLSEENLAKAQDLARTAQWYWDFVFVENSDGVHNKTLTKDCLDKAEKYLGELNTVLGA